MPETRRPLKVFLCHAHDAIVVRELGIPAAVGCNDATLRINTGGRLRVDGGKGTVEILESPTKLTAQPPLKSVR